MISTEFGNLLLKCRVGEENTVGFEALSQAALAGHLGDDVSNAALRGERALDRLLGTN